MHPTNLRRKSANAAATAEQRHITYHKVSQSHLPTPAGAERKQRGGSGGGGELTAVGGGGGLGDTGETKKGRVQFPSLSHLLQRSPRDHIGSEAEHEGADEGADLPRRSLSSPLLLLQATLANTGDTESAAGLQSVGHTKGRPQSVYKIPRQHSKEWTYHCLFLMRTVKSGC